MLRIVVITLGIAVGAQCLGAMAAERVVPVASSQAAAGCNCGDSVSASCDSCDSNAQSGYGLCVAPWARLSYGSKYKSYYVGGSVVPWPWSWRVRPEPRLPWEGTWGRDYAPALSGVGLWWSHGPLYQDGIGQYEPDRANFPFFLRFGKASTTER